MNQNNKNFIEKMFAAFHIPYHFLEFPCDSWEEIDLGLRQSLIGKKKADEFWQHFFSTRNEEKTIYQFVDLFEFAYYLMPVSEDGKRLVIGPLIYNIMTDENIIKLLEHYHLPPHLYTVVTAIYKKLTPISDAFPIIIQLITDTLCEENRCRIVYERDDDPGELVKLIDSRFEIPGLPLQSILQIEKRYRYETELIMAVTKANVEQAAEYYNKICACAFPQRLNDILRDRKDLFITLNTLLRKAAEQVGVHPIEIDAYSNQNIRRIEEITDPEQCHSFGLKMVYEYCRLIDSSSLLAYSLLIRRAITYIRTNLSADLSLHTLAKVLCVNSSYLSTLFKKETKMSLTEFVNRCRMFQAQQYLSGTDLPIKTIAQRCGISDINYFTRMFKRIVGVTPRAYRMHMPSHIPSMQNQT